MTPETSQLKTPSQSSQKLRIAFYTHDTYGLGHVTRVLRIMREISQVMPDAALLIITGCPALHAFQSLPANADFIKIPTIVKTGLAGSKPPHLPLSVKETTLLRSRIIRESVVAFAPDVLVVDNFPLGSQSELRPVLEAAKEMSVKMVLGLRDILDSPETVMADWKRQGIYDVLDQYYHRILVYGSKKIYNMAREYALSPRIAKKIRYCGYVTDPTALQTDDHVLRKRLGITGSFILISGGGGGDAYPLFNTYIDTMPLLPENLSSVLVLGPMMGKMDKNNIKNRVGKKAGTVVLDFIADLHHYLEAAEVIVCMCGYNTAGEIMGHQPKTVLVPRTWKYGEHHQREHAKQEMEQILRAKALAKYNFVRVIEPQDLNSVILSQKINELLAMRRKKQKIRIKIDGVQAAAFEILSIASS